MACLCVYAALPIFGYGISWLDRNDGQLSVAAFWNLIYRPDFTETGTK